jgi:hypothetical protein
MLEEMPSDLFGSFQDDNASMLSQSTWNQCASVLVILNSVCCASLADAQVGWPGVPQEVRVEEGWPTARSRGF